MTEEKKPSTKVGFVADKLFKLAAKGAKKLEDYAEKSAAENNNENAKKLAAVMNKFGKNLEEKHDAYIAEVDRNTENLISKSKETLGKAKQVYGEMKTRAETAKEKADKDSTKKPEATAETKEVAAAEKTEEVAEKTEENA